METLLPVLLFVAVVTTASMLFYNLGVREGYLKASEERQDDFTNMDQHL